MRIKISKTWNQCINRLNVLRGTRKMKWSHLKNDLKWGDKQWRKNKFNQRKSKGSLRKRTQSWGQSSITDLQLRKMFLLIGLKWKTMRISKWVTKAMKILEMNFPLVRTRKIKERKILRRKSHNSARI